ncbi:MAG: hypothetical protein ACRDGN_02755 [bacterium]
MRDGTDVRLLARAYHAIISGFIRDGRAPHYTELAVSLSLTPREALAAQHVLTVSGLPIWMHPDTDHLAAASPFSNIPTPYRVSVEGEQKWYAL